MACTSAELPPDALAMMRSAFNLIDKNGDGRITATELLDVINSLQILDPPHARGSNQNSPGGSGTHPLSTISEVSRADVDAMIKNADVDGNGTVEFDEFVRLMKRSQIRSRPLVPPGQSGAQQSHSPSTGTGGSCSHSSSNASSLNMSRPAPPLATSQAAPPARPLSALDTAAFDFIDNEDSPPPPLLLLPPSQPPASQPQAKPQPQQQCSPPPPPPQQSHSQSPNGHSGPLPSDSLESRDSALPPASADSEAPKYDMDELREAFTVFDHDRNGFIDRSELQLTMKRLGEQLSDEDLDAMMKSADTDGDGCIDLDEFRRMMMARLEPPPPTSAPASPAKSPANASKISKAEAKKLEKQREKERKEREKAEKERLKREAKEKEKKKSK